MVLVVRCEISMNRDLVFASTTCDALTGLSHAVENVVKRRRPCYGLSVVPMYHLKGGAVCCVQSIGTIPNVGDAVQANILVAIQHSRTAVWC
jgi:hypothetical protein